MAGAYAAPMAELRVVLDTTRYDESCTYYESALGWTQVRDWGEAGSRGCLYEAGVPGGSVELLEAEVAQPPRGVMISIEVDDVAAAHTRLAGAGAPVDRPPTAQPWGHVNMRTHDPNGLSIVLFEVRAAS
jgi:predicted enzyme related to lactoylglutathione lyase